MMTTILYLKKWQDLHTLATFTRHVDTLRALGKVPAPVVGDANLYGIDGVTRNRVLFFHFEADVLDHFVSGGWLSPDLVHVEQWKE